MGAYIMFGYLGIVSLAVVIYLLSPKGKEWLKHNNAE